MVLVVAVATVAVRFAEPVNDGDLWFHMAYGRYFIQNHTLIPDHSIFTWTPAENDTIYCAWISQTLLYLLYDAGGMNFMYATRYLIILIFAALTFSFYLRGKRCVRQFLPVMVLVCIMGLLMSCAGLRIKAELFSFLFMTLLVWAWLFLKTRKDATLSIVYLFPLIFLIWVNTHGAFIFGFAFFGLVMLGEILNVVTNSSEKFDNRLMKHLVLSFGLSTLALSITPYGWHYIAQLTNDLIINTGELRRDIKTIGEYQSIFVPQASILHFVDYLFAASIILIALFWASFRKNAADWALIIVNISFLLFYMKYLRSTYYWGIIFAFSSSYLLGKLLHENPGFPRMKPASTALGIACSFLVLLLCARTFYETFCAASIGFNTNYIVPFSEAEYINKNYHDLVLGNDYNCGSYLLWSLGPNGKVFIDARYFPFKKWFQDYNEFSQNVDRARVMNFLNKYRCDLWCLSYAAPVLSYFASSPDWKLVYYGPSACVFVSSGMPSLPENHSVSESVYHSTIYNAYNIGRFATTIGDLEVARKIAREMSPYAICLGQAKTAINVNLNIGNALLARKRYTDAIELYSHALDMQRKISFFRILSVGVNVEEITMLHDNLGLALLNENQLGQAQQHFQNALRLNPDAGNARKYLPALDKKIKKIDEAISRYKAHLIGSPDNLTTLNSLAMLYSLKGQYQEALDCLMRALKLDPENPNVYYNIACIHARQRHVKEALEYLEQAIAKGFNDWSLLRNDHDMNAIRNTPDYARLIRHE